MGLSYLQQQNYARAIKELRTAQQQVPENAQVALALGQALQLRGLPEKARQHYQKALEYHPDKALVQHHLGALCLDEKKYAEAIDWFDKALASETFERAWYSALGKGDAYYQQDQPDKALKAYQRSLKLLPNHPLTLYRLGELHYQQQRYSASKEAFQKLLKLRGNHFQAHLRLAQIAAANHSEKKARQHYSRVMALRPESKEAAEARKWLQKHP